MRQRIWRAYNTRRFKYDRDKLWLVYIQIVPVIFEPPCTQEWFNWTVACGNHRGGKVEIFHWKYNKFSQSKHKFTIQINQLQVSATFRSHHQPDPKNIKKKFYNCNIAVVKFIFYISGVGLVMANNRGRNTQLIYLNSKIVFWFK